MTDREDKKIERDHRFEKEDGWPEEEWDEEQLEAFFQEAEEEEIPPPFWQRKKVRKGFALMIAAMMMLNVLVFLPRIYSLPAIQFLKKSRELSQKEEIQTYKEAVVVVHSDNRKGTGFLAGDDMILTNDHVVEDEEKAIVNFADGDVRSADVIARDSGLDIALLQIREKEFSALPLISDFQWKKGESVYIIGNPLYFNRIANEGKIWGMLENRDPPLMALDAPIYKGNSGSPVINREGEVIAVVFATTRMQRDGRSQKVGLAVPMDLIMERFPVLEKKE